MGISVGVGADIVAKEPCSVRSLADAAFLGGDGQLQVVGQEFSDLGHDLTRLHLAADHTDKKIVGVTAVAEPLVFRIESIGCRNVFAFRFQPIDLIQHGCDLRCIAKPFGPEMIHLFTETCEAVHDPLAIDRR